MSSYLSPRLKYMVFHIFTWIQSFRSFCMRDCSLVWNVAGLDTQSNHQQLATIYILHYLVRSRLLSYRDIVAYCSNMWFTWRSSIVGSFKLLDFNLIFILISEIAAKLCILLFYSIYVLRFAGLINLDTIVVAHLAFFLIFLPLISLSSIHSI